jgi:hypothetical protein
MNVVRTAVAVAAMLVAPLLCAQYTATFEEPTFSLGDVNGQDGWGHLDNSPTGGAIETVPAGSPASFGAQSLAIRTRNSLNFGVANRLYSATIDPPAGETGSTVGGVVVPSPESTFQASFWYHAPETPLISSRPDGRFAELDPSSKGNGPGDVANRYAQVRIFNTTNTAAGSPRVEMRWFLSNGSLSTLNVATLDWNEWYRFDYTITLVDGLDGIEANDRFTLRIYDVDGSEVGSGCGSTWELGWKSGTFGGGATARAINGFDFWSMSGPDTTLVGHLDNLTMTATTPAAGPLAATISGSANTCAGATVPLTANDSGGTGPITSYTWRDSSNAVVGTGSSFAASEGTYTVTITDSLCETATSAAFTVTAYAPLAVTVSGETNVCFGGTTTLTANATGGSGSITSYTWRDSTSAVVGSGATFVAGAGTYTVTVNDATCGLATSNEVTVQTTCKATPVVTWTDPADITYGTPLGATQLNATANVAGTFTYTPPAGTVLNAGENQVLSVDFTPTDSTNYEEVNGTTVEIDVLPATPFVTVSGGPFTYDGSPHASTAVAGDSVSGTFTFTYDGSATAPTNAGTYAVEATFTSSDPNYTDATGNGTLIINKATPVISWSDPADIGYGTPLSATQLDATADVAGTFTYAPPAGTILNAGANQTLSVDFTPSDTTNYNAVNGTTVQIDVFRATPVLTWSDPADITYGTPLSGTQLNATADVAGTFTYVPPAGTVLNAGANQTLSVDFTPSDSTNYNNVNGTTVQIDVLRATPVVTWSNPANITYGTPLSGTQLNATADVAGTFTYTPPAGTVLNAGANQTLSVDFAPTDSANYNAVNGTTVQLTVDRAPTTTTITTVTPSPSDPGQTVTIGFTLGGIIGTPTGTVTITDGVDSCTTAATSSGCTIAFTTTGTRTLTATYSGDANHLGSISAGRTHVVGDAFPTAVLTGSTEICDGNPAVLRVQLTGDGPWTITWSDDVVERAQFAVHERTVTPAATTSYTILSVRDSNRFGEHSGVATVTVTVVPPPVILDAPRPELGQPVTLRATAGYTSYQWFRNGTPLVGETSETFTVASFSPSDAGRYTVTGSRDGCVSAPSAAYALVPLNLPLEDAVIPVVGTTHGFGDSLFRTTVYLINATTETMEGELTFIDGSLPAYPYILEAGETRFIEDLLPVAFNGLTSANVRRLRGPLPIAIAHIFNDAGDLGTSGLIERAIPADDFLETGDAAVLITPIDPVTTRFNIGLRSLREGLSVRIVRRSAEGMLLGTSTRTLPPSTLVHEAASTLLGAPVGSSESLTFEITAGGGAIYGAATDNGTNDPNMQIAEQLLDVARSGHYVLPVAGAINGLFNSRFATGLQLHNPSAEPLDATLTFHPGGTSGSDHDPHLAVTVPAHGTAGLDDLVTAMHTTGLGSLDVVMPPTISPVLLARVYSIAEIGQTSLMTDLIPVEDALHAGEEGVVAAPHAPHESRFNIGLRTLNLGARLTATVRNKSGDVLRVTPLSFPATYFVQTDASSLLGIPLTGDESVLFTIEQGSAVIYGVWTDNVTQDPAMQYAVRP